MLLHGIRVGSIVARQDEVTEAWGESSSGVDLMHQSEMAPTGVCFEKDSCLLLFLARVLHHVLIKHTSFLVYSVYRKHPYGQLVKA